ncbi:hypothetical protein KSP39_PZI004161 [Platanthera zijinensis]|uniref:Retrotransposon gag domain-containing protein n=1 Tax=Platanthera zijinensis TaxID=2320716 RepID=A0AAP0GCH7_9ASPA
MGTQFENVRHDIAAVTRRLDLIEHARDTPSLHDNEIAGDPDDSPRGGQRVRDDPPPADRYHREVPVRVPTPPAWRNPEPTRGRPPPPWEDYRMPRQPGPRNRVPPHGRHDHRRDEYYPPGRRERGPPLARHDYDRDDDPDDYHDPRRGDRAFDITRRIRLDAPTFDGRLEPKAFSDWLLDMDHYFDWYDMSDERCVRFAKMKLVGQAKVYWISVERALERDGYYSITRWDEMKHRLSEKYLPASYRDQLFEQLQNLRQGTLTVAEYMARFDELVVRSDISEEPIATASRFKAGLRSDLRRELIPHRLETVDQIFQLALEYEQYLRTSSTKQFPSRTDSSTFRKPTPVQTATATPTPRVTLDVKGKAFATEGHRPGGIECFRCSGRVHVAAHCSTRNLLIEDEEHGLEGDEEVTEKITAAVEEGWESDAERSLEVGVVRRFLHTPRVDEDWRRTTIFYTYFPSAGGPCKLAIDSGSCVNIVAQKGLDRMQNKVERLVVGHKNHEELGNNIVRRTSLTPPFSAATARLQALAVPLSVPHVARSRSSGASPRIFFERLSRPHFVGLPSHTSPLAGFLTPQAGLLGFVAPLLSAPYMQ